MSRWVAVEMGVSAMEMYIYALARSTALYPTECLIKYLDRHSESSGIQTVETQFFGSSKQLSPGICAVLF